MQETRVQPLGQEDPLEEEMAIHSAILAWKSRGDGGQWGSGQRGHGYAYGRFMFSSVQSLSHVRHFVAPWTVARQASLFITDSWSLLRLMSIEPVMPSNHLILCRPLFLLPLIFPSIRIFSNELALHIRYQKYWSFSFSISSSKEYSGLISFNWLLESPCSPRESQETSPTPRFKSINSLGLSFLYSPTLTSIHGYWKNHSFD